LNQTDPNQHGVSIDYYEEVVAPKPFFASSEYVPNLDDILEEMKS
jgi:hypothetical protein